MASRPVLPRCPERSLARRCGRCCWHCSFPISPRANCADVEETYAFVNDLTPIAAKVESVICGESNLMLVNDDWLTLTFRSAYSGWVIKPSEQQIIDAQQIEGVVR